MPPRITEGTMTAKGFTFGIVVSRYNEFVTSRLLEGARAALLRHGAEEEKIHAVRVPGAFEIPIVAREMALSGRYNAIICLGAVIRGATPHFDYIASAVSSGVARVGLDTGIPVLFGVLTTDTVEQAVERAGTGEGNKGLEAALSAIEMVTLLAALKDH